MIKIILDCSLIPTASSTTHLAQYSVVRNLHRVLDQEIKTIVKFSGLL